MSRHEEPASKFRALKEQSDAIKERNDCTVTALAAATGLPYLDCHAAMAKQGRQNGKGSCIFDMRRAAESLGFNMDLMPRMVRIDRDGTYKAKTAIAARRDPAFKSGAFILSYSGHVAAIVDGNIIDWTAGRRHRIISAYRVTPKEPQQVDDERRIKVTPHQWREQPEQLDLI